MSSREVRLSALSITSTTCCRRETSAAASDTGHPAGAGAPGASRGTPTGNSTPARSRAASRQGQKVAGSSSAASSDSQATGERSCASCAQEAASTVLPVPAGPDSSVTGLVATLRDSARSSRGRDSGGKPSGGGVSLPRGQPAPDPTGAAGGGPGAGRE